MAAVWSPLEKHKLLQGLHKYGPRNLDALHKLLPNKTKLEIQVLCEEHSKLALKKTEDRAISPTVKLWLKILRRLNESKTDQFHDSLPRVLKYIGLFEKRVPIKSLNISECYMYLAKVCRGLDPSKLDENSKNFMYDCLTKLAKYLKYNGECGSYRRHVASLHSLKDLHSHRKNIHSRIEQSLSLNPIGIPDDLLDLKMGNLLEK